MTKNFTMENDVGIPVNYTVLGVTKINDCKYVVFTNHLPSDNEFGVRLLAGKLVSENPIQVEKLRISEQKPIIEDFKIEMIQSGAVLKK